VPPRILLEQVPAQCKGTIAENPFLEPIRRFPASVSDPDQKRLSDEITAAVIAEVLPAYQHFLGFIEDEYIPHGRATIGLSNLPDGARRYQNAILEQTTTRMSAAQIFSLGQREVARINLLLAELAHGAGYGSFRLALNGDPRYIPTSADAIVADYRHYIEQMQPHLPELFNLLPKTPLTVEAVPSSQQGNATHYVPGTPDGSRPARVVVAVSRPRFRRKSIAISPGRRKASATRSAN
jgi:uncharacterized protein (DUF885 family)